AQIETAQEHQHQRGDRKLFPNQEEGVLGTTLPFLKLEMPYKQGFFNLNCQSWGSASIMLGTATLGKA
ncbi:MAG: hypothetical protein ACOZCF_01990, partial [Bacillota bacterium]